MDVPSSVYRLQLNEKFPLKKAIAILPYLHELGIEGIYCSPIFACSSDNGYEVTNPNQLNPLLGTPKEFDDFCSKIKKLEMKLILDIVPNHMSLLGKRKTWWSDVLEKGPSSLYAKFFDIQWNSEGKIILPILNEPYETVIKNLELEWDDGYWICYNGFRLPIARHSYPLIDKAPTDLHKVLERQFYRLCYWKENRMNYRRFFNLNHLIGTHIEDETVLKAHHHWIFELLKKGKIHGLRIDHIDGLYNPTQYLKRLAAKKPALLLVEKILMPEEKVPNSWPIDGTVGYEFLNLINGLFIDIKNESSLTKIYDKFLRKSLKFQDILYQCRRRYVLENAGNEIGFLVALAKKYLDYPTDDLAQVLREILIYFREAQVKVDPQ